MANAESEHVPPSAIAAVLNGVQAKTWSAFHEAAHREEEQPSGSPIESPILVDIIGVARQMDQEKAPFPDSFDDLVAVVNQRAKATPHR